MCPLSNLIQKKEVLVLIDSSSEVNTMTLAYILKLGFKVYHTNIKAQKIDGFTLNPFEIVLADFQIENKLSKAWFFQKTFLIVNITLEVIFGMSFLTFSNIDIQFEQKKLT